MAKTAGAETREMSKNSSYYELEVMENQRTENPMAASQPETSQVTHPYNLRQRVSQAASFQTQGIAAKSSVLKPSSRASAASKAASIKKLQVDQQRDDELLKLKKTQEGIRLKLDSAKIKFNTMVKKLKMLREKNAKGEISAEEKQTLSMFEIEIFSLEEKMEELQAEYTYFVNTAEAEETSIHSRHAVEREQVDSEEEVDSDSEHGVGQHVKDWANSHFGGDRRKEVDQVGNMEETSATKADMPVPDVSPIYQQSHLAPQNVSQTGLETVEPSYNTRAREFVPSVRFVKEMERSTFQQQHPNQTYPNQTRHFNRTSQRPPPGLSRNDAEEPPGVVDQLVEALGKAFGSQTSAGAGSRIAIDKDLPYFSGKPEEWLSFKLQLERTTICNRYTDSENLFRLRKALKGEAWEAVQFLFNNPANVPKIIETLQLEFGRPELIIENLIRQVETTRNPDFSRPDTVVEFARAVQTLYVSIESHGQYDYLNNIYLLNKFVEKLPTNMKREWIIFLQADPNRRKNMESFHDWISEQKRLAIEMVKPKAKDSSEEKKAPERRQKRGPGGIHVAITEEKSPGKVKSCIFCNSEDHRNVTTCLSFSDADIDDRWKFVKSKRLCFSCLLGPHAMKNCKSGKGCAEPGCKRRHHTLLHTDKRHQEGAQEVAPNNAQDLQQQPTENAISAIAKQISNSKPLSIVPVVIEGTGGTVLTYALLDSGANVTVVEASLAEKLKLNGQTFIHRYSGVGGEARQETARKVSFKIRGKFSGAEWYTISEAITMSEIGLPYYSLDVAEVKRNWPHLKRAKLEKMDKVKPELIIGEDHPYLTVHRELLEKGSHDPIAKRTKLGWVLAGDRATLSLQSSINFMSEVNTCYLDKLIKDGFSLEAFGVVPIVKKGSIEDRRALKILEETTVLRGDRWECGLLWKEDVFRMPESKQQALRRLCHIERKMQKDFEYAQLYHNKIAEYEKKGFIREVSKVEAAVQEDRTWYVPHFGVFNPNKPGKIRLVFDAAAKNDGLSLNDYLLTGPDLIRPLLSVLWNFRIHNVAIMGDIEDMFHRVLMKEEDKKSQRFLWKDGSGTLKTYEMEVMIFGAKSSPASAIFVKNKNSQQYKAEFPEAARIIEEDFYVDDCLTGARTESEAVKLRKEICDINSSGGFHVKKWTSSSGVVIESIPPELRADGAKVFGEDKSLLSSERVLGLWWNPGVDTFTFKANFHKVDSELLEGRHPTKREMCSLVMSVFDPVGFLGNFKIKGMIILQMTWRAGVGWDDYIPDSVYDEWKVWVENLKKIENVTIPRLYAYNIQDLHEVQLHTFVDASEEAFAAVSYFRISDQNNVKVSFVSAKVRVAPLKKLTIPRLELLAALLGTRLATKIGEELRVKIKSRIFWSDSQTVLQWIRSESMRFKEFVANRIGEIHEQTSPSEWKWVPTSLNPADEGTRLKTKVELSGSSFWLCGPEFLLSNPCEWPPEKKSKEEHEVGACDIVCTAISEELQVDNVMEQESMPGMGNSLVNWERFSSFNRLIRCAAGLVSAVDFWKYSVLTGPRRKPVWELSKKEYSLSSLLTPVDIEGGEMLVWKLVQQDAFGVEMSLLREGKLPKRNRLYKLQPYVDQSGIMKVKGRFGSACAIGEMMCHPIILPGRHHVTSLLIMQEHIKNGHQGQSTTLNNLRKVYWILDARAAVRRVSEECLQCRLRLVKPIIPEMGNIPHFRLAGKQPPFTFTGVDYYGPAEVTVGRHHEKRWVALFTCMVTRAIHLEVAYGLSADEMLLVLSRFIDCRGRPLHIYSDNGTNFVGANKELKAEWEKINWTDVIASQKLNQIQWHFQPPGAPHMSGVWERLVQSVKKILKSTLKEKFPRDQTLLTILKGAENIVNSRPLTYVSGDINDPASLTPNDFLRGFCDVGPSIPGVYSSGDLLREQWRRAQVTLEGFWKRWTVEYLPSLLLREKWHEWRDPIRVGDLVLLVDETLPRNCWRRGVVTKTILAKDGQVRQVEVRVTGKELPFRRPVSRVCPLGIKMEMPSGTEPFGDRNCRGGENAE